MSPPKNMPAKMGMRLPALTGFGAEELVLDSGMVVSAMRYSFPAMRIPETELPCGIGSSKMVFLR